MRNFYRILSERLNILILLICFNQSDIHFEMKYTEVSHTV